MSGQIRISWDDPDFVHLAGEVAKFHCKSFWTRWIYKADTKHKTLTSKCVFSKTMELYELTGDAETVEWILSILNK